MRSVVYAALLGLLLAFLLTSCPGSGTTPTGPSPTSSQGATTWP